MYRPLFNPARWAIVAALAMLCLAACVDEEQASSGMRRGAAPAATQSLSLFAGTVFDGAPPQALSLNRDLTEMFVKQQAPGLPDTMIKSYDLADGLGEPADYMRSEHPLRAFVQAHPTADECLAISHVQDEATGQVRDAIWSVTPVGRTAVDYRSTPGLPDELPPDACYSLAPIYSWDGSCIIVPLHGVGLCVYHTTTREWRYAPYPPAPGVPTGQSQGAVPDSNGNQHIYVSRWQIGHKGEWCQVSLFNIQSGEWVRNFQIHSPRTPNRQWVIYSVAGADVVNEPWLVRGSRAPQENTEKTRVPRLARVDPLTGHVELLMFYGDPYWPVALDPSGRYVVYLDRQRQAIARLDTQDQVLEYDPRWYSEDAQLFVAPGAGKVFVWYENEFIQAQFTEREELEDQP